MKTDPMIRTIEIRDRNGRIIGTKDVVTYQGLLSRAHEEGLKRVTTELVQVPSDANDRTAIAKASVETGKGVFEAFGDANPGNVNSFIVPHLIRMAETRAKARALRDAVNVGILSAEEVTGEDVPAPFEASDQERTNSPIAAHRGGNGDREPSNGSPSSTGHGNFVPMTESQNRYLFRILGNHGYHGDMALEALRTRFAIKSLDTISKTDAVRMIAELLEDSGSASHEASPR